MTEIETHTDSDGIAWVRLNRPEKHNALTFDMRVFLAAHFEELGRDASIRAVVISAAGKTFCAGADLEQFGHEGPAAARARFRQGAADLTHHLSGMEKPVLAAVNGPALGLGWTLALACDLVIASDSAQFGMPYSRLGLVPDAGALYFLARQLGYHSAIELIYSARNLSAPEALDHGLVTEVVAAANLQERSATLARKLAGGPTFALGMTKMLMQRALGPSLASFLDTEMLVPPQLRHTDDFVEGIAAFREKRPPRFKGC